MSTLNNSDIDGRPTTESVHGAPTWSEDPLLDRLMCVHGLKGRPDYFHHARHLAEQNSKRSARETRALQALDHQLEE